MRNLENGEFKGGTIQAIHDIVERLDRIEEKLDRQIERNVFVSAFMGTFSSIVVTLITIFSRPK